MTEDKAEKETCPCCGYDKWILQTINVHSEDEFRRFLEAICFRCGFRMIVKEFV